MMNKKDRPIFKYHDGTRPRVIDPAVAWRNLWTDEFSEAWTLTMRQIPEGTPDELAKEMRDESREANATLLGIVREVFGIPEFGEKDGMNVGLVESELNELIGRFMVEMVRVKKKRSTSRTWWQRMVSMLSAGLSRAKSILGWQSISRG